MEPNEHHQQHLSSAYYQPQHHHHHPSSVSLEPPTNGILPSNDGSHVVYPNSVPSSAAVTAPLEPVKRRRGRPRKYGTPEQALAAKRMAAAAAASSGGSGSSARNKRENPASFCGSSSRKSQLALLGNTGKGFTPHIINVGVGEDVGQKIMYFMQQSKHELCIISASGTISNASLSQPATSGGNITYEGQFEILSLSGSYVRTELGRRNGGLSICLSSTDGQIIGGVVAGPLKAAGPVQVIVSTFKIDTKMVENTDAKVDASGSGSRLSSPAGAASMGMGSFRSSVEASGRNPVRGNDEHDLNMGGSHFMIQQPPREGMHMTPSRPSEWGGGFDGRRIAGYDLAGRIGHLSSENGDYDD